MARTAADVRELAASAPALAELVARESVCRACPRLVRWREEVAEIKRRSYQAEPYWGRPVPGWGDEDARILITGLAPAAHGGNRTGRIFTGDRSGDFLFAALHRCGLAAQATSVAAGDGQRLIGVWVAAAVRCAPPANRPDPVERDTCAPWLAAEVRQLAPNMRVIVALGGYAWQATWPALRAAGFQVPRPRPAFGHGAEAVVQPAVNSPQAAGPGVTGPGVKGPGADASGDSSATDSAEEGRAEEDRAERDGAERDGAERDGAERDGAERDGAERGSAERGSAEADGPATRDAHSVLLIGCYHPSQQNTFTGKVTPAMLDEVFRRARDVANGAGTGSVRPGTTRPGTARPGSVRRGSPGPRSGRSGS